MSPGKDKTAMTMVAGKKKHGSRCTMPNVLQVQADCTLGTRFQDLAARRDPQLEGIGRNKITGSGGCNCEASTVVRTS